MYSPCNHFVNCFSCAKKQKEVRDNTLLWSSPRCAHHNSNYYSLLSPQCPVCNQRLDYDNQKRPVFKLLDDSSPVSEVVASRVKISLNSHTVSDLSDQDSSVDSSGESMTDLER